MLSTLISASQLNELLESVVVVDCRFDLANPGWGAQVYAAGHIPGAVYAHLDEDLSGPKSAASGRHPLPSAERLIETLGNWGVDSTTQVVVYDQDAGMYAARLWWLLRWMGHKSVAVLDGGFKGWLEKGYRVSTQGVQPTRAKFRGSPQLSQVVDAGAVASLVRKAEWRVLDARAPERFRGEIEPIDPVAGHIPGARNHPFAWNLGSDGRFLERDALKTKLTASLDGVSPERTILMCGSGVTACHTLLALEAAGMPGAKLYAGSWSEWIRDPERPVAKGA